MSSVACMILITLLSSTWSAEEMEFPPQFKFGVATSSYQVEGAWNASDKGKSIWDRLSHAHASSIDDHSSGDVACDSYHQWERDVDMVAELGVQFYRISISWPRLLPKGYMNHISVDGKNYYNNLINSMLEKGIEPVVSLYHWDLPQNLQDLGGWSNPLIVKWFVDYAKIAFSLFGDRVKTWITISQPSAICDLAYGTATLAPGIFSPMGVLLCSKHVLLAHAKAWRVYDGEFRSNYKGQISIANRHIWMEPATENDTEVADQLMQYQGRFANPIYSNDGGWPASTVKVMDAYSKTIGFNRSILPDFTKEEIDLLKGTSDFYAFDFECSQVVRKAKDGEALRAWPLDAPEFRAKMQPYSFLKDSSKFNSIRKGLWKQLVWLKSHYGDLPFLVSEKNYTQRTGFEDWNRTQYFKESLEQVLFAINENKVNVTGYTVWSLMDGFEWNKGYTLKSGLYEVDFSAPNRTRTARGSAVYYRNVIKTLTLEVPANISYDISQKSSSTPSYYELYVIGGIILMMIILGVAGIVIHRMRRRAPAERKMSYVAVYDDVNMGDECGDKNGSEARSPLTS